MGSHRVPVYYDFASTLCFVAHRVMGRMDEDLDALGVELVWRPLDLTRLTGWRRGDPISGVRRRNVERVLEELDVTLMLPEHWMDSRVALAASLLLEGEAEARFREQVWAEAYERGRSLDEGDWVAALARELGVTVDLGDERARGRVELATREAAELEVSGVPTFLLGSWPLGGIQEIPTMRAVLARYIERQ